MDYPENIRYKLLDRQAKCFAAIGKGEDDILHNKVNANIHVDCFNLGEMQRTFQNDCYFSLNV